MRTPKHPSRTSLSWSRPPSPTSRRAWLAYSATALAAAAAAALGAGCAARPDVRHDRDPAADLRAYKTFAFQETRSPLQGGLGAGYATLQEARLQQAARLELERHGLTQVVQAPDLRVHLAMRVIQRQELRTSPGVHGIGVGYRGWSATRIDSVDVRHGTLVVDLVDTRRNALVWRGVAEGAIERADAQDPGPAIDRAMSEVFAGFKP